MTWERVSCKNPDETPYTSEGMQKYMTRTGKKPIQARVQELIDTTSYGNYIKRQQSNYRENRLYTFEFYMNRCYAFNRDKGKCKICGKYLYPNQTETHHINIRLPNDKVNKITNLATVCADCHENIHRKLFNPEDVGLESNKLKKLNKYRDIVFYTMKGSKSSI